MEKGAGDKNRDDERYLKDIQEIKEVLLKAEKQHLVEPWAYFIWGIIWIIGGILHYITEFYFSFGILDLILKVWLPVFCVGGLFETVAYAKKMTKEHIPLLSGPFKKLVIAFTGLIICFGVITGILVKLNGIHYLPVVILLFIGICFICYALLSCVFLFVPALFLIIVAMILFIFDIPTPAAVVVCAFSVGLSFIAMGIQAMKSEKK